MKSWAKHKEKNVIEKKIKRILHGYFWNILKKYTIEHHMYTKWTLLNTP
jgi:hypothetical protein